MPCEISVVVPAYNAAEFIDETLRSILSQTLKPHEIIVVDDASTDDTVRRVQAYGKAITLLRLSKNTGGCSVPRNLGIDAARSKYVAPFDADDVMYPHKLERQWAALQAGQALPVVFSDFNLFGSSVPHTQPSHCTTCSYFQRYLQPLGKQFYALAQAHVAEALLHENYIGAGALVLSKDAWRAVGGYDENLPSAEDLDFSYRLARHFAFGYVPATLFKYRQHAAGKSRNRIRNYSCVMAVIRRNLDLALSPQTRRAALKQLSEMEIELAWRCSDSGRPVEALRYWWNAWRTAGPTRRMLRHSRRLAWHCAALSRNYCLQRVGLKQ